MSQPYPQWEYMEGNMPNNYEVHQTLNDYGSLGWELMTIEYRQTNVRCWFKRVTSKETNPATMLRRVLEDNGYEIDFLGKCALNKMEAYCEDQCRK
jgi:hypothetical protein